MEPLTLSGLLMVERVGWDALAAGRAAGYYAEMLAPDGVMVFADGIIRDRSLAIATLEHMPRWELGEIEGARLVLVDVSSAALMYSAVVRLHTGAVMDSVMTSVYRWEGRELRLAFFQQTPCRVTAFYA